LFSGWVKASQSLPGSKFYISKAETEKEWDNIEWTLPIETLIISELQYRTAKSICTEDAIEYDKKAGVLRPDMLHYRAEGAMPIKNIDTSYFNIKPGYYTKLPFNTH